VSPPATLPWWEDGERLLGTALGRLTDQEFDGASLLPGWSRRQLLAHVARNADALVNLLTWARTGVETPMYASPEARESGIAEAAALPPAALAAEVQAATGRLAEAVRKMPEQAWVARVRTAQGRTVPAAEVPWMRCREVWVHAVDLTSGVSFADVPEDVLAALVTDVVGMWNRREQLPDATFSAHGRSWGQGAVTVSGSLPALTGWLTGRTGPQELTADGPLPALPVWL
jgi:maleylpyruvate isomerase